MDKMSHFAKQKTAHKQAVLLISSHVIRGSVGSRVSVCALEHMGFPVWNMLTVSMTWQPAHGTSHRLDIAPHDFAAWADDIVQSPWSVEIGTVMTGYFASQQQVEIAAKLIRALKLKNKALHFFCDPVMGDEQGLYIAKDIAGAIVHNLLPLADTIKPNRSELEWIVDRQLMTNDDIITAARQLTSYDVLVTSACAAADNQKNSYTGNLLVRKNEVYLAEHRQLSSPVTGLGDMTAALFLAHQLHGKDAKQALYLSTTAVYWLLSHTLQTGANELMIEDTAHAMAHASSQDPISDKYVTMYDIKERSPQLKKGPPQ